VTDLTSDQVVDRCRTHWLSSGVDSNTASDMAIELRSHLQDALAEGKSIESVVGSDLQSFAEEWASAYPGVTVATKASASPASEPKSVNLWLWVGSLGIMAAVGAIALLAGDDPEMDTATWATVWIVAAGLLAAGELMTAGFFLLPFAVGAGAAGVLALAGVGVAAQFIVFVVVSIAFLVLLQRFARKDMHGELVAVGSARYVGAHAMVIKTVDRRMGSGRVKMGMEDWRATTNRDETIPAGTEVTVVEVRGTRLVVEPSKN
jgi:membrane protein implicated in regulation of membrane protease activity